MVLLASFMSVIETSGGLGLLMSTPYASLIRDHNQMKYVMSRKEHESS